MYAEVVQTMGTLVTIAGLVVVAPFEAGQLLPNGLGVIRRGVGWLGTRLIRLLPDRRGREHQAHPLTSVSTSRSMSWGDLGVRTAIHGTPEEQLDAVRRAVIGIYAELDYLLARQQEGTQESRAAVEQLSQSQAELRKRLEEQESKERRLNMRGFPLAAVGALLAGTPGSWLVSLGPPATAASTPTAAWFVLAAIGLLGCGAAAHSLIGCRADFAQGWREAWQTALPTSSEPSSVPQLPSMAASGEDTARTSQLPAPIASKGEDAGGTEAGAS